MGKLSGRPGPDSYELIEEAGGDAYLDDELERRLQVPTREYTIVPACFKVTEFDQEGHAAMAQVERLLEERGVSVLYRVVPTDGDPNDLGVRAKRHWGFAKINYRDVLASVRRYPGEPIETHVANLFGSTDGWAKQRLDYAKQKVRMHFTRLRREGSLKVRFNERGDPVYFTAEHVTDLPLTPGGLVREPTPPGALLEENVTRAANYLRMLLMTCGVDVAAIERGTLIDGEYKFGEPTFVRDTVKQIAKLLTNPA